MKCILTYNTILPIVFVYTFMQPFDCIWKCTNISPDNIRYTVDINHVNYIKKVIGFCCLTFYLNCFSDAEAPPDNIIKFHIDTYHWTMRFRSCRMECQPVLHWVSYNESWYIALSKHSIIYLCFIFYKRVRYNIKVALSWIVNYIV